MSWIPSLDGRARQLSWAIAGGAVVAITGNLLGPGGTWLVWIAKPLTTILVLLLALRLAEQAKASARTRWGIVVGLLFSLAGDVFLMLPQDLFVAGLASFLVAHLCYLVAFTDRVGLAARPLPFLVWTGIGVAILAFLWPGLPTALRIPVLAYVVVLLAMAAQSGVRGAVLVTTAARAGALGGGLFAVSDAVLAIDRFRLPFALASAVVLTTYWLAQWLIALSVTAGSAASARS